MTGFPSRGLSGVLFASVVLLSNAALASDKPEVGVPPAWVKAPPPSGEAKPADQTLPFIILLNDVQFSFDDNSWTEYHLIRGKVQSQAGLQAFGAIPYLWSPASDTLTFHSAKILRDGQAIDILPKAGNITVLRREPGLESAMLTGELTALLQPEGLQVGDTLELAVSIRHAEPLLAAKPSAFLAGWDGAPVVRFRMEARWPATMPMKWQETPGMPPLRVAGQAGSTIATLDLENVRPTIAPANAPVRFQHGKQIEFSTLTAWQDVADIMSPLYAKAAEITPGSALAQKVDAIAKASTDRKARAGAALALVEDQVRYLAHADQDGGYTPQSAEDTWRLRYGDCKAKTALLLAMLKRLDVPAEPVLAHTSVGDAINGHLPSPALFNHILVRVNLDGHVFWLDGTRQGDRDLDSLDIPNLGWVLPMQSQGSALVRLVPEPAKRPQISSVIRYDASKGVTAPLGTHFETIFRGDTAYVLHTQLSVLPAEQHDAALKTFWTNQHSAFTPTAVSEHWDAATREEKIFGDGTSVLDWSGAGLELQHVEFGGKPDIERDPAASDPDAPYLTGFPTYTEVDESVVLPPGLSLTEKHMSAADVDTTLAGVAYHRAGSIANGVVRVVLTQRTLKPEASVAEAKAAVEPLKKLGEEGVYVPAGALARQANNAAALEKTPTTAGGHIDRGSALLDSNRYPEAVTEFDAAIALEPTSQRAFANRAVARAWMLDPGALADADKADSLGQPDVIALHARAILARRTDKLDEARGFYRRALALDATDKFSLWQLYDLDLRKPDLVAARNDLQVLLKAYPDLADWAYGQIAQVELDTHDRTLATEGLALIPSDTAAGHLARGRLELYSGATDRARAEIDASIKLHPTPDAWVLRATVDRWPNQSVAEADIRAALQLDPDHREALFQRMEWAHEKKDFAGALADANRLVETHPEVRGTVLAIRAQLHQKLGHATEMDADFQAARAITGAGAPNAEGLCANEVEARWRPDLALGDCEKAVAANPKSDVVAIDRVLLLHRLDRPAEIEPALAGIETRGLDPYQLNNICYGLARENFALERALELCDAAIKGLPSASHLDSRAFVLLRMGRNAEALTAYNAALNMNDGMAAALYGRGIIEARLGQTAASARDLKAGLAAKPSIRQTFKDMGVADK